MSSFETSIPVQPEGEAVLIGAPQAGDQLGEQPMGVPMDALPQVVDDDAAVVTPGEERQTTDDEPSPGRFESFMHGLWRNKVAVAAGVVTVASVVANPIGGTLHTLAEVAPYVGTGMAVAEAAWIGGAAMMLAGIGKKIGNPLKIRSRMKEITEEANDSLLFKAGLAINTAGALAEFIIPTIAVTANLPIKEWGILGFTTLDLWATVVLRKLIWRGMHPKSKD